MDRMDHRCALEGYIAANERYYILLLKVECGGSERLFLSFHASRCRTDNTPTAVENAPDDRSGYQLKRNSSCVAPCSMGEESPLW